jgi:hypothetical protein
MRDKHKESHILFVHRPGGAGEVRRPSLGRVGCVGGRADGQAGVQAGGRWAVSVRGKQKHLSIMQTEGAATIKQVCTLNPPKKPHTF